jgi:hypothetical protein
MAVRLSASRADCPLPPGRFLVLISVRGWVDPKAIVRLEGLGQLKHQMTCLFKIFVSSSICMAEVNGWRILDHSAEVEICLLSLLGMLLSHKACPWRPPGFFPRGSSQKTWGSLYWNTDGVIFKHNFSFNIWYISFSFQFWFFPPQIPGGMQLQMPNNVSPRRCPWSCHMFKDAKPRFYPEGKMIVKLSLCFNYPRGESPQWAPEPV